jgi:hypothetical protein
LTGCWLERYKRFSKEVTEMLSLEIIVVLVAVLALVIGAMVRTQLHRGRLPVLRGEGRSARA